MIKFFEYVHTLPKYRQIVHVGLLQFHPLWTCVFRLLSHVYTAGSMNNTTTLDAWTSEKVKDRVKALSNAEYSWKLLRHRGSPLSAFRKAAVLVPLTIANGELYVWLTLRAKHLAKDPGKSYTCVICV